MVGGCSGLVKLGGLAVQAAGSAVVTGCSIARMSFNHHGEKCNKCSRGSTVTISRIILPGSCLQRISGILRSNGLKGGEQRKNNSSVSVGDIVALKDL